MDIEFSSDDSIAWTSASSDSHSSTEVTSNMKHNCASEIEDNIDIDSVNSSDGKKHKKKAKKRRHDEDSCDNDYNPAKKKKIKIEPESDKEKSETVVNIADSESFVNLRIKQEDSHEPEVVTLKKKKKHKKDKESVNESEVLNGTADNDSHILDSPVEDGTSDKDSHVEDSIKKKKKKKKSKHRDSEEGESTKNRNSYALENDENEHSGELINIKRKRVISSTFIDNDTDNSRVDETNINDISAIPSVASKKTTRISDRLQFEDDENITKLENGHEMDNYSYSREVKTFLKSNPTFTPVDTFAPFNMDDDDVWILKCPTEVNINDLKGVNLALDGKSKIKIAGQTYDGTFDEMDCKQPIVTYSKKRVFLKNVPVLKTITFRKRIPVPHIQDDNVVMNDYNSFIPLPDTKSRHPLFGINYKKAIKLPKSVGQRLAANDTQSEVVEQDIYKKKKKKHKKEKNSAEKEEFKPSIVVKEEEHPLKIKKRKHKIKEENDVKPAKRIKLEQDPGTWESEKAIEENLFNF